MTTKENNSVVIQNYEKSLKNKKLARTIIGCSLLTIILMSIICLYSSVVNFKNKGIADFTAELQAKLVPVVNNNIPEVTKAFNEVYPAYYQEFEKMFENNLPKMEEAMYQQISALEDYAETRKPDYAKALENFIAAQKVVISENFASIMSKEDAKRLAEDYEFAAKNYLERFFANHLLEHQHVIDEIRANLKTLTATEPDIAAPIELGEAVGMFLELAGIKLQEEASKDKKSNI